MEKAVISVIVPVYNVEAWLPACVDSILAQDFTDFELILVDDGSPDHCPALCDAYAKKDDRIRVIHQKNGGLSAARNSGICLAKGDYIAFIDSDDTIAKDYLQRLYTALCQQDADMAICTVEDVSEEGESLPSPHYSLPDEQGVFTGQQLMHKFFCSNPTYYTVAWNKLYRAKLWKELRYPEGMIHEDDALAHLLYSGCDKVVCLDETPLYFYRLRKGSICRTTVNGGSFDGVSAHAAWCRFFAKETDDPALLNNALRGCWQLYLNLCSRAMQTQLNWSLCARWQEVQYEMRELLPLLSQCSALSLREKLSCHIWAKKPLPLPPKSNRKRVALLLPPGLPVPPVQGGAVETLAQHLMVQNEAEKELELAVICQYDPAAASLCGRYKNTLIAYQPKPKHSMLHSLHYHWGRLIGRPIHWNIWYQAPLAFLRRLDADVLIAEGGDLYGWQQASRILGRQKFVAHLHGEARGNEQLDKIYSQSFAISNYIRTKWQNGTNRPCTVVPNCVDTNLFSPKAPQIEERIALLKRRLGYSASDFVVLFCGRTCPEKGIHQLISAFDKIKDPAVKLLVIGSPFFAAKSNSDYFDKLKANAGALQNRVQFTGFVPNADLPDYYRMADAACFPAVWEEPAGITAIEALACGCPVIATVSGGMPEYLEGSNAILIERSEICTDGVLKPVEDVAPMDEAIAAAIVRLKNAPELCESMSQAGAAAALRYSACAYYKNTISALH